MAKFSNQLRQLANTHVMLVNGGKVIGRRNLVSENPISVKEAVLQCVRKTFGEVINFQLSVHAVRCVVRKQNGQTTIACKLPDHFVDRYPSVKGQASA